MQSKVINCPTVSESGPGLQMPLVYCVLFVFQISVYITVRSGNVMRQREEVLSSNCDLISPLLLFVSHRRHISGQSERLSSLHLF